MSLTEAALLQQLQSLSAPQLRRMMAEQLTKQKLGLYWERSAIDHDRALNANVVLGSASQAANNSSCRV